jgi:hypothetical protein
LQDHPAGGQARAARRRHQCAGQAVVPDNAFVNRVEHVTGGPDFIGQHLQDHGGMNGGFADGYTGNHSQQQSHDGQQGTDQHPGHLGRS